jgi:hypothetical protein
MGTNAGTLSYQGRRQTGWGRWAVAAIVLCGVLAGGLVLGRVTAPSQPTSVGAPERVAAVPQAAPFPASGERALNRAASHGAVTPAIGVPGITSDAAQLAQLKAMHGRLMLGLPATPPTSSTSSSSTSPPPQAGTPAALHGRQLAP